MNNPLGFREMPEGYNLMMDNDEMYWYWLRDDGEEGPVHWNRWWVYHSAVLNKEKREALSEIHAAINA